MKIFNIEDGTKVVYVQMNDLGMLSHYEKKIPASIFLQVFSDVTIIDDRNRWEFQRFTDPSEVEFFQNVDWIVDYKVYRHMREEEIVGHGQLIADEMNEIANEFNNYLEEERRQHMDLPYKHELLDFKFHSLPEILWLKQGYKTMPIPEVPDSDGFTLSDENDEFPYIVKQGLNPLQMLLFRKDGKPIGSREKIPMGFIQSAGGLLIIDNTEKNEFFGDFEMSRKMSEDNKYLITTYRIITPEEKEKMEKASAKQKEQMKLGKRIKNAFGKLVDHIKR